MTDSQIYLDYAAATPIDESVLELMLPYLRDDFYNPSANYISAIKVKRSIELSRAKVAHWLGAKPSEIIFTAGATEANNLAIHGLMSQYPEGNVLVSSVEHESVLVPANEYNAKQVRVMNDGRLDLSDLKQKIDESTVLVSVMQANNEIGTLQPIKEISKLVQDERKKRGLKGLPIYFHTDSAQAGNYLDLHASRLGVDLMSLNGGKIYGPKQSGVLFIKTGVNLRPQILGGGQERSIRSGTENVSSIVGLSAALEMAQAMRDEESTRLSLLRDGFIDNLTKTLPEVILNGSTKYRLPNNVHISVPGQDNERLLMELDNRGILAAAGSACSASNDEPSHVLKAIGKSNTEARNSLRLTLGRGTTEAELKSTILVLAQLV
jgi:cysteine desulfurase